jgi:uncharacterized protein YyaL (SSP411 family)
MMAKALLAGSAVLHDDWARDHALRTLAKLAGGSGAEPRLPAGPTVPLAHAPGVQGLLEDQVHAADAALHAFEATGDAAWLSWAESLMEAAWTSWRDAGEGLLDRVPGNGAMGLLTQPVRTIEDAPVASPNGVAGIVFARLAAHRDDPRWSERHRGQVEAFAAVAPGLGLHAAAWLRAADWLLHPPTHLVITGSEGDPVAGELHRLALRAVLPRRVVRRLLPDEAPEGLPPELKAMLRSGPGPRAYLCRGARCEAPVDSVDGFQKLLGTVVRRPEAVTA